MKKEPFVQDCPHCKHFNSDCPCCNGTGKLEWDWYYGMKDHVFILKEEVVGQKWRDHYAKPEFTPVVMDKGSRVKVVMCSRFGDVGITPDLNAKHGYIARIDPNILEEIK